MKKRSKKEIILIISLIILIFLFIGLVVIKISFSPKKQNDNDLSFEENLEKTINEINEVNKVFDYVDIENGSKYELLDDSICYKYIGEKEEEYIKKIEEIYIEPFYEYSNFNIVISQNEEELYVCKRKDCEILNINNYEILLEEKNKKVIGIENSEYVMHESNDEWKFKFPVVICK